MDPPSPGSRRWSDVAFRARRPPLMPKADTTVVEQLASQFPDRYRVREEEGQTFLVCLEAPTLRVRVERGFVATPSMLKSARSGSIYLDGAAHAPPEVDIERGVLNLDHHQGCVRPFTLATCEQAFILVSKGLDLHSQEWTIYANEPDLDTVLAIWVLLNHRRIVQADPVRLRPLVRLLRLEGAIDAHGLEYRHYCGFSDSVEEQTFAELESLLQSETELKKSGEWASVDFCQYTADQLRVLDQLVYQEGDFQDLDAVEEIGRASLGDGKLAIACLSQVGIYRVEGHLRDVYGERLGLIILQKDPATYTLRQVGAFSKMLERVYERLNLIDPAAGGSRSSERWGGSAEIGGSPRGKGTHLSVEQILDSCRKVSRPPTPMAELGAFSMAALVAGGLSLSTLAVAFLWPADRTAADAVATLSLLAAVAVSFGMVARGPGLAGVRLPVGFGWLWSLPLVAIGVAAGGGWLAGDRLSSLGWLALVFAPLCAELLFRGTVYGILLERFSGQEGRYRVMPLLGSSVLYALSTTLLGAGVIREPGVTLFRFFDIGRAPLMTDAWSPTSEPQMALALFLAALLFGLSLGWMRRASESVLPPLLMHWLAAVLVAVLV